MERENFEKVMKLKVVLVVCLFLLSTPFALAEEGYYHIFTLESPEPENHAWYGYQVKICGDIIAVTEPNADVDDFADAGKVYLYDLDGTLLSTLQSPTPGPTAIFGDRFDIHQNILIVKEYADFYNLDDAGRAYAFSTNGTYKYTLESPEPRKGGYYGTPGIYEDIIAVHENRDQGVVYLYNKEGEYLKTVVSPTPLTSGDFGRIIEVSETLVFIGEVGKPSAGLPVGTGTVYVFNHDGEHIKTIKAPVPEDQALFGSSISVSGNNIVIGESYATVNGTFRAGRAHIYNTDGEHLQTLQSPYIKMNGQFGDSVAIDGERIVVGEWDADVEPHMYEGRAYIFDINGVLLANLTAPSPCPRAAFGLDVDIEGDVVVVGECWAAIDDFGQAGRVHVYRFGEEPVAPGVEETSSVTETEEEATDSPSEGIPGFPATALLLGLMLVSMMLACINRCKITDSPYSIKICKR
jgi:hypothetical protein